MQRASGIQGAKRNTQCLSMSSRMRVGFQCPSCRTDCIVICHRLGIMKLEVPHMRAADLFSKSRDDPLVPNWIQALEPLHARSKQMSFIGTYRTSLLLPKRCAASRHHSIPLELPCATSIQYTDVHSISTSAFCTWHPIQADPTSLVCVRKPRCGLPEILHTTYLGCCVAESTSYSPL